MSRHLRLIVMGLLLTLGGLGLESAIAPAAPAGGQDSSPQATVNTQVVIKTESSLVLVDVIATDKKGNYIKDLERKDFHVYEDDAEAMTVAGGERRWVPLGEAAGMPLTGLARKVLARLHLLDAIAPLEGDDVL